jgi:hypothetical protein
MPRPQSRSLNISSSLIPAVRNILKHFKQTPRSEAILLMISLSHHLQKIISTVSGIGKV